MKKILIAFAVVALLLGSCKKDKETMPTPTATVVPAQLFKMVINDPDTLGFSGGRIYINGVERLGPDLVEGEGDLDSTNVYPGDTIFVDTDGEAGPGGAPNTGYEASFYLDGVLIGHFWETAWPIQQQSWSYIVN